MRTRTIAMMLGLLAVPVLASAEMISGTITNIDPSAMKVTLLRADTNDSITVFVKDQENLSSLKTGSNVTVDANKKLFGGWEAQSVEAPVPSAQNAQNDLSAVEERAANREAVNAQEAVPPSHSSDQQAPAGASPVTPSSSDASAQPNQNASDANASPSRSSSI